jgi:hypothetical protein
MNKYDHTTTMIEEENIINEENTTMNEQDYTTTIPCTARNASSRF